MARLASAEAKNDNSSTNVMVARQPVYNQNLGIYAYEFLFRCNNRTIDTIDATDASGEVLSNFIFHFNMEDMMCGRKAILNTTPEFLSTILNMPLPAKKIILDITEDTPIDKEILDKLRKLTEKGYEISVGGIKYLDDILTYAEYFDIYRVNSKTVEKSLFLSLPEKFKKCKRINLLATMMETMPEYMQATQKGYEFAQGYFLSHPQEYIEKTLPDNKIAILNLLATVFSDDSTIEELNKIISEDVALSFKLLKLINSPFFSLASNVESIRNALVLLGRTEIRNFAAIITLKDCDDQPLAMIEIALLRAKICELLAESANLDSDGYFTVGMFSALDLLMNAPIKQILDQLPLSNELKDGILLKKGGLGQALECATSIEEGQLEDVNFGELSNTEILKVYHRAIKWSEDLMEAI